MKYINKIDEWNKLFENATKTYIELTPREFNDCIFDVPTDIDGDIDDDGDIDLYKMYSNWVGFSDSEFKIIKDAASKIDKYVNIRKDYSDDEDGGFDLSYLIINRVIHLYHLKDDWYYVHHKIVDYGAVTYKCYKCDQMDGLLDCLKDIL